MTVKITSKDQIFEAAATVLYSRPMLGIAVAFREVKPGCLGGTGIPCAQAFQLASTLQNGTCGLTDGSSAGDWSLPGVQEIKSLFAPSAQACVPDIMGSGGVFCLNVGTPWASNLQVEYWTVNPAATGGFVMFSAWLANVNSGTFSAVSKAAGLGNVWPVRGNMKQTCNTAAFGGTC